MTLGLSTLAGLWLLVTGPAPTETVAAPEDGSGASGEAPGSSDGAPEAGAPAAPEAGAALEDAAPPPSAAPDEGTAEGPAPPPEPAESTDPTTEADASDDEPAEPPAPLPEGPANDPPAESEPRALGGVVHTPLPPAPEPEDPSTLTEGPWRGRGWLGLGVAVSIPVGGTRPAAGTVVSAAGEITLGWRINRIIGLHTALSTFAHDSDQRTVDSNGTTFDEVDFGRMTAFDLVTARVYLPRPRRIEPWAEAGLGIGIRRGAFAERREAVGLARTGLGVDFWLAPTFSLGVMGAYRLAIIEQSVGHGLRAGADLSIHW